MANKALQKATLFYKWLKLDKSMFHITNAIFYEQINCGTSIFRASKMA